MIKQQHGVTPLSSVWLLLLMLLPMTLLTEDAQSFFRFHCTFLSVLILLSTVVDKLLLLHACNSEWAQGRDS